jgi:hypothetical protein
MTIHDARVSAALFMAALALHGSPLMGGGTADALVIHNVGPGAPDSFIRTPAFVRYNASFAAVTAPFIEWPPDAVRHC